MKKLLFLLLVVVMVPSVLLAQVNFSALREREDILVNLDESSRPVIVEKHVIPLQKGINPVNFSWQGVNLDRDSIRLNILDPSESFEMISTTYPSGQNKLTWNISSARSRELVGFIIYHLKNIRREVTYNGLVNEDEDKLEIREEQVLFNNSGQDFNNAMLKLGYGNKLRRDWQNGESKRFSVYRVREVPFNKVVVYDGRKFSFNSQREESELPVYYELANSGEYRLGNRPLTGGKIRLYQGEKSRKTFIGEDRIQYTPVGDTVSIYVGNNRNIKLERSLKTKRRLNVRRNDDGQIELYDLMRAVLFNVENFGKEAVTLRIIESMPQEWQMESTSHDFRKINNREIEFEIKIDPGSEEILLFEYQEKNRRGGR
jgi:hypothetical protein